MTDPLLESWAGDEADARFTPQEEFARRHSRFERRIRRRNLLEYLAGGAVMAVFGWIAVQTALAGELVITLGWIVAIVGMGVVLLGLHRRASLLPHRLEADGRSHLRAQYERQRRALASVSRWYLAPLVPGMVLVFVGSALPVAREIGWPAALGGLALPALIVTGIFAGIAWLNRRTARALEREIAALDALA
ncbi:hypothetical protein [Pelagerythrobacter sp.]|uniref:hypothetical protein n=1 Tax=Pelagerythrobacter sp. TaxID=2800702 RepID=UPI0035B01AC8